MKTQHGVTLHSVGQMARQICLAVIVMALSAVLTGCGTVNKLSAGYHAPILGAVSPPAAIKNSGTPVYLAVDDIATKSLTLEGLGDGGPKLLTTPLIPQIKTRTVNALKRQLPNFEFSVLASGATAPANSPVLTLSSISFSFSSTGAKHSGNNDRTPLSKAATDISLSMSCNAILSDSSGKKSEKSVKVESAQKVGGAPEKAVLSLLNDALDKLASAVAVQAQGETLAVAPAVNVNSPPASDSKARTDVFLKGYSVSHQEGLASVLAWGSGLFISGDAFAGELAYSAYNCTVSQSGAIPISTDKFQQSLPVGSLTGNFREYHYSYSFPITTDPLFDDLVLVCITKKRSQSEETTGHLAFLGRTVDETMKAGISSTWSAGWPVSGGKCWLWFRPNLINGKLFIKKECVYTKKVTPNYDGSVMTNISYDPQWFVSTEPFD